MNQHWKSRALPLGVIAYCTWQSADLVLAWRHAPFDRGGWLSFLIWLCPAAWAVARRPAPDHEPLWLTGPALLLAIAGSVADVNAVSYLALALAAGALVPRSKRCWLWLAGALVWMPALGWVLQGMRPEAVMVLRWAIAISVTAPCLWLHRGPSCVCARP